MSVTPNNVNIFKAPSDTNEIKGKDAVAPVTFASANLTDTPIEINSVESLDTSDTTNSSDEDEKTLGSDSDTDDVVEPELDQVPAVIFDRDYYFSHIYNGIVFKGSTYYPMIEFKIIRTDQSIPEPILFKETQFKCGWFIVDGENSKLRGPVGLNKEKIKTGLRVIDDKNFPEIDGSEIESVSNEKESMITREQIPHWMTKHMVSKI